MTAAVGFALRRSFGVAVLLFLCAPLQVAFGQAGIPIPIDEQVRIFNSLPPAQQQQLIRELQRQLPPAQREAIIGMLQGRGTVEEDQIDLDSRGVIEDAFRSQTDEGVPGVDDEPRLKPGDTVVLEFTLRPPADNAPPLRPEDEVRRDEFLERLANGNPYQLDSAGQLFLPGVPAISLAGLNADEATVRVQAEPALRPFTIVVTRLPLDPVGIAALEPFGYDLFQRPRTAFTPPNEIPVPADYVVGPGDTVNVQLFGSTNNEYFLEVSRDGTVNFPEIGPVNVAGLSFAELRETLNQRVTEQLIGVRASITLGELRTIRVFILGDVERPGSYSVSGLSTVTNALFTGGGVKTIGSLRNITVRRDGATIATLDLYDLLLRGDTRGDVRLQAGDTVFVPTIGPTVAVSGEVRRPAVYELRTERTLADVISLAGGVNANANRAAVKVERIVANRGVSVDDLDLARDGSRAIQEGDVIYVQPNLDQLENSVRLAGNVFRPGVYRWFRGMRLSDLLPAPELVKPMSDLNYVLVKRELAPNVDAEVRSADLARAWRQRGGPDDLVLESRDTVHVFNLETGREPILAPLIAELKAQAPPNSPLPVARVAGQVRAPGEYPLEPQMRISDLLRAGGGLTEAAYGSEAELTRYIVVDGQYRETALTTVDMAALLRGDPAADLPVSPYDYLNVKEVSNWRGEESVTLRGEVVFPGTYPIRRGETLSSVLARAGGLTELAFPEGGVFTREELREREREQLEVLARRVERDLAAISVTDPNASDTITTGQALIQQLRSASATGRLVIRLSDIVAGIATDDIVLKDGDMLVVPDRQQEVTVLGEVQYATSHLFDPSLNRDDYISRSGGPTQRADERRVYVVRASGEVVVDSGARWFRRTSNDIQPGDTIVVPLDVDQPLARWTAITQIIYNLAIAAAAVNSF